MRVTIYFQKAPGPQQVSSIELRVETADFAAAVAQAITFIANITTVKIERVVLEPDQE